MAGKRVIYPGGTAMNSLNYFGLPVASAGLFDVPGNDGYEVLTHLKDEVYRKVVLKDGKVAGMTLVSDIGRAGIIFGMMRDGVDVSSFRDALLSDDFSLASLPEELRRRRLSQELATVIPAGEE
jgi:NAD(P)H-nitrite reductase large subunit